MRYEWLLFDADGTLFDYDKAEANALAQTFVQHGFHFNGEIAAAYRKINHKIWQDFEQGKITATALRTARFERLFEAIPVKADPQTFSQQYLQNLANASDLFEGTAEIIKSLNGRFHLSLITNGLKDVQRPRLAQSAIGDCFAAVIISDEIGIAKPDTGIFDVAFARMGSPAKSEVLIIGDSLTSDIQGGENYGIDTCWFNPAGKPRPPSPRIDYQIAHLSELQHYVS